MAAPGRKEVSASLGHDETFVIVTATLDEPFHREGFRRNVVPSSSLRFTQPELDTAAATMRARAIG
jgi:hypothetical protein